MNRQGMFQNVNLRVAKAATVKQIRNQATNETKRVLNDEFLKKVGEIRRLEDELLALQYQKELLVQQNMAYKEALEKIKSNNEIQQGRIEKLEEEVQMHRTKNRELQDCEDNLTSLYEEINELSLVAERKNEECGALQAQKSKLLKLNEQLEAKKKDCLIRRGEIDAKLQSYLKDKGGYESESPLLACLKVRLEYLLESIALLKSEEDKIKREMQVAVSQQKEKLVKLEYEEELLRQRLLDGQKSDEIAKICANQMNLENIVENMLLKEDELSLQLSKYMLEYEQADRNLRNTLQGLEDSWAQERQKYQRRLRELKKSYSKICYDSEQKQIELNDILERHRLLSIEYQLMCKLKLNLSSMQRFREVQQRNNHLKLKIRLLRQIKDLAVQQRQLIPSSGGFRR